jgi:DNA primase
MHSSVDTEQLRADHPIDDLIARYGIDLRPVGSALVGRCPFHLDRGRPNLHVYSRSGRWICYRCGEGGDIIDFVRRIDNLTFPEAVAHITGGAADRAPETRAKARRRHPPARSPISCALRADDLKVLSAAADLYANRLLSESAALAYLARRGFGRDILERYRVGYASGGELIPYLRWRQLPLGPALRTGLIDYDGREVLAGRITFSEFRAGRAIWMIGRVLETPDGQPAGSRPKYLGLPGDKPIFGWEDAMQHPHGVCVVEGPVDLLALRMWEVPGVALAGNRLRYEKLVQLERFERLYVALDPDAGGQKGMQALVRHLGSRVVPVELPGEDDVGKLASYPDGKEQLAAAIVKAAKERSRIWRQSTSSNGSSIVIQNEAAFNE